MSFTIDQINHVAKLARLQITKQEMESYYGQLPWIIESVSNLQKIEVPNSQREPTITSPPLQGGCEEVSLAESKFRDDTITCPQGIRQREKLLACSANRAGDYIAIPAIFD